MKFFVDNRLLDIHYPESSEELPYADGVFTYKGREKLFTKLCALGAEHFVEIYTSDPFVLTIGCHKGKPFSCKHPVAPPVAPPIGNGNGLVLIGNDNTPEVWMSICVSLWQRLHHGGVNPTTAQSLAVVKQVPCTALMITNYSMLEVMSLVGLT